MKARNEYAGAGRALKRTASKAVRQDDQRAMRDELIDEAEDERLAAQETFAESLKQLGWTPAEAGDGSEQSAGVGDFRDLGLGGVSKIPGDFQEPGLGGLSHGS